jgi:hypothetical protein
MKKTIGKWDFMEAFKSAGRGEQFSRDGLEALFEELEAQDEEMELDVIAICCDYCEYPSAVEACADLGSGWEADEGDDEEEQEESALDYLRDRTSVIQHGSGIIIQNY